MPIQIRKAVNAMEPMDRSMRVLTITEHESIHQQKASPQVISISPSWFADNIYIPFLRVVVYLAQIIETVTWNVFHCISGKQWSKSLAKRRFDSCPISHSKEIVTTTNFPLIANKFLVNYYHSPCNRSALSCDECSVMRDNNVIYVSEFVVIMENMWKGPCGIHENRHMISFYK